MAVQKDDIVWKNLVDAQAPQVRFTMASGVALRAVYYCACFQAKLE